MIYFTADEHYNHRNIADYAVRPWRDVEIMNYALIAIHNSVVAGGDTVYHLGDFAFSDPKEILQQLDGREHHLILGNHDYKRLNQLKRAGFTSIQDIRYLRWEGKRFFLSHYAHRTWRNSHHGSYHLFGHSHGMLDSYNRSMDVGVDAQSYAPISIEDVCIELNQKDITLQHPEEGK